MVITDVEGTNLLHIDNRGRSIFNRSRLLLMICNVILLVTIGVDYDARYNESCLQKENQMISS